MSIYGRHGRGSTTVVQLLSLINLLSIVVFYCIKLFNVAAAEPIVARISALR